MPEIPFVQTFPPFRQEKPAHEKRTSTFISGLIEIYHTGLVKQVRGKNIEEALFRKAKMTIRNNKGLRPPYFKTIPTGQWSEPMTSLRIRASLRRGRSTADIQK